MIDIVDTRRQLALDPEEEIVLDSGGGIEDLIIPPEMFDFIKILVMGAKKYAPNNWLEPDGHSSDHKSMHASMFRHLAESSAGITKDHESGLDPLLHLMCRAGMVYVKRQRGIKHEKD